MVELPLSRKGKTPLEVAKSAAQKAGELIAARFYGERHIDRKGRGNVVTDADYLSEKTLLEYLCAEFPDHTILTEESDGVRTDSPFTWILDPLDGSRNYASGIPHFGLNVALTCGDEVLVAVTHDPIRRETFSAQKGSGAHLNDMPISAS
jgi:myo-inositol-1(or 4)-monophosphatase